MVNIENALKDCFIKFLNNLGIFYPDVDDLFKIAHKCFLVLFRLIPKYKFYVCFSKELASQLDKKEIPDSAQTALYQIKTYLEEGKDLNVFQSKTIFEAHPYFSDHLLTNWRIYHFHLSEHKNCTDKYFVERSDYLLMVTFHFDNCYFIKVYKHNDKYVFSKKEMVEIIEENWPFLLEPMKIEGITDISYDPTDEELSILWRKVIDKKRLVRMNLNVAIKGKKGYYISFPGIAADGTPEVVSESLLKLKRFLTTCKEWKVVKAEICFSPKLWKYCISVIKHNCSNPYIIPLNFP